VKGASRQPPEGGRRFVVFVRWVVVEMVGLLTVSNINDNDVMSLSWSFYHVADCDMARLACGVVRGSGAVACAGRPFSWALVVVCRSLPSLRMVVVVRGRPGLFPVVGVRDVA
jgi:hypothetical protein